MPICMEACLCQSQNACIYIEKEKNITIYLLIYVQPGYTDIQCIKLFKK